MSKPAPSSSILPTMVLMKALRAASSISRNQSAVTCRVMEVGETISALPARNAKFSFPSSQFRTAEMLRSTLASSSPRPPIDWAHSRASMASSTQSIEGVLIVEPSKTPSFSFPFLASWKILGSGRGGV